MLSSTLSGCEFGKVAESAKEVLSLVEQLKRQIEQIEPHSGDGIADLEHLVAEADPTTAAGGMADPAKAGQRQARACQDQRVPMLHGTGADQQERRE